MNLNYMIHIIHCMPPTPTQTQQQQKTLAPATTANGKLVKHKSALHASQKLIPSHKLIQTDTIMTQ